MPTQDTTPKASAAPEKPRRYPTPGPWRYEPYAGHHLIMTHDFDEGHPALPGEIVANTRDSANSAENANLIAWAPMLLKLLAEILRAHDSGNNGAYMGEAVLCAYFADYARDIINRIDARQLMGGSLAACDELRFGKAGQ